MSSMPRRPETHRSVGAWIATTIVAVVSWWIVVGTLQASTTVDTPSPVPAELAEILEAPHCGGLVVEADGDRVAWTLRHGGTLEIWVARIENPSNRLDARPVFRDRSDDGQAITGLRWVPGRDALVFGRVRTGGDADVPNPLSLVAGVEPVVWLLTLDAEGLPSALVELGSGSGPIPRPDGSRLAWIRDGSITTWEWDMPVFGSLDEPCRGPIGQGRPSVLGPDDRIVLTRGADPSSDSGGGASVDMHQIDIIRTRGRCSTPTWSPLGTRLAFVDRRGDHDLIGVHTFGEPNVVWLDPSVDSDASPVWLDEDRLVFLRRPTGQTRASFVPRRAGIPWSIRIADARDGSGRALWTAPSGPGSYHRPLGGDQLRVVNGDRILFAWERTGWLQLYTIATHLDPHDLDAPEVEATPVTRGAFEVADAWAPGPEADFLWITANKGDRDGLEVWRVRLDGGNPLRSEQLSRAVEIAWSPVEVNGAVIMLAADAQRPGRPVLLKPDGGDQSHDSEPIRVTVDDRQPWADLHERNAERLVDPRTVRFPAADGRIISGQLFLPRNVREDRSHPAILFFHGGSKRQMYAAWHPRGYYHNAYGFNQYLATRGYVVLAVNYRSGTGYGLEFREAEAYGASGASEFFDVLGAGLYLRGRPEVDPEAIGLWGGSYGGYLTALGLARASDLFAAGVDLHGVYDWNVTIRNFDPDYDPLARPFEAALARRSSPVADIARWRSPVLVVHGDDDGSVPFAESVALIEDLRRFDVPYETLILPDEGHSFRRQRNWLRVYARAADFFDRHLNP